MDEQAPGLRAQLGSTVEAAKRLVRAHVALATAEAGEIVDAVKRMLGLALVALAVVLFAGVLILIGGLLFVGEWLFGSLGWGVLLGGVLLVDIAVVALLAALEVPGRRLARDVVVAAIVAVVVGIVLAGDLAHQGWSGLGDSLVPTIDPAWRATVVAVVALAVLGGILGLILGVRGGGGIGAAIGSAIGVAIIGAIVGIVTAIAIPVQVGAALGVLVGLVVWPVLSGLDVARRGIDGEALKARFMPDETIGQTKETIEWVRARLPLAPKS